ncbi:MAG: radical SAM protein [Vulcanimicrobiota bacterium]
MKILLIYPRLNYPAKAAVTPPLGILYIASVLRREGHDVTFLDLTTYTTMPELEPWLAGVDMAGLSITSAMAFRAYETLRRIKEIAPSLFCIAGGPHATVMPEDTLRAGFDAVVLGEGEATVAELARAREEKSSIDNIAGLAFLRDGALVCTSPRPFIESLDTIPEPARDLVNWAEYYRRPSPFDGVIASRGCPYRCLFCKPMQEKLFGKKVRYRSQDSIIKEIARYIDIWRTYSPQASMILPGGFKMPFFPMFLDDMFLSKASWVDSFCDEVEKSGLSFWWGCQARVDAIEEERLSRMKQAGCRVVACGVESGSQQVLDFLRKDITVDATRRAFGIFHKVGISTHAYIIIGSPLETKEELQATFNLLEEIRPTTCYVARATPQPGSYLYEYAEEQNILNVRTFDEHFDYYYTRLPLRLMHLREEDLDDFESRVNELFPNTIDLRLPSRP